ncbi:MAG: amidohydrolase [bacterium]
MILIKNSTIITQDKDRLIIPKGVVLIDKDKIKFVGDKLPREYFNKIRKEIDGRGKVVMPGLINTHGHLAMTLLRGYADDLSLEKWWMDYVYPVESKFGREEVYWGSLLAMAEMIKSGTTCFADFYYYEDEVGKAAKKIGMRGNLGCGILDVPTFYFKDNDNAFKKSKIIIDSFEKDDLLDVSLAPHMFQTTSLETYQQSKKIAQESNLLLQTHVAETKQEVSFCLDKYDKRPIELLYDRGVLDNKTVLAHCCWLSKKEIKLIAKNKSSVVHCPVSNMKLASGVMPLQDLLRAGVNVSLGTDGACSNNNLDMFEEMKFVALLHKINKLDATVANAQMVLDMATINGAKVLDLENKIGSLEINKKADIIILDFNQLHLTPWHNVISHLIYSSNGGDVSTVIINGRVVMEDRKIKQIGEQSILSKINKLTVNYK